MTNVQILKKAIEKAVKNGYSSKEEWGLWLKIFGLEYLTYRIDYDLPVYSSIIFSHGFAKAFWGNKWEDDDVMTVTLSEMMEIEGVKPWQYHLKKMILKKDKLQYIKKFL